MAVHEDPTRGWPPARRGLVTVDLGRGEVVVTTPDGDRSRVSMEEHRADVIRRLLERGLSTRVLTALLPEFEPLIEELSTS